MSVQSRIFPTQNVQDGSEEVPLEEAAALALRVAYGPDDCARAHAPYTPHLTPNPLRRKKLNRLIKEKMTGATAAYETKHEPQTTTLNPQPPNPTPPTITP